MFRTISSETSSPAFIFAFALSPYSVLFATAARSISPVDKWHTQKSLTIFGDLINDKFIKRSSARSSDHIYVSGTIGDSALGLHCKKKAKVNILKKHKEFLFNRYLRPNPRIDLSHNSQTPLHLE